MVQYLYNHTLDAKSDWFHMLYGVTYYAGECQYLYRFTKFPKHFVHKALKVTSYVLVCSYIQTVANSQTLDGWSDWLKTLYGVTDYTGEDHNVYRFKQFPQTLSHRLSRLQCSSNGRMVGIFTHSIFT